MNDRYIEQIQPRNVKVTEAPPVAIDTNGLATSINQETLNLLVETLQELTTRLTAIASTVANTAQLRVVATGAVTATGPITSAQSIAEKAVAGISYPEKMAITNNTAIQSNINNTTV